MYMLYADESGRIDDPAQQHFVLAGFCAFERQGWWLEKKLHEIASRFNPADPTSVELHGSPMFVGRNAWRRFPKADRIEAMRDALNVFANSHPSNRLFASVVKKSAVSPRDPVEIAFEQLASRFDKYLIRLHKNGDTQRGLIVFDKTTYESTIQTLATDFRTKGYTWGIIRNFAEVPLFLDSKASRLIQLADLLAYAIYRYYEKGDTSLFSLVQHRFDSSGGITHGLFVRQ